MVRGYAALPSVRGTVRRALQYLGIPTQMPPLPSAEVEPIIASVVKEAEHLYPAGEDVPIELEYVEELAESWGIAWAGVGGTRADARWATAEDSLDSAADEDPTRSDLLAAMAAGGGIRRRRPEAPPGSR